jgi:peptidoglycan-associated lipoprotein
MKLHVCPNTQKPFTPTAFGHSLRLAGRVLRRPAFLLTASVAIGALATACSSTPPKDAKAPLPVQSAAAPQTPPKSVASAPPAEPDSPTASSVHVDDAILKACGIQAPKAFFAFDSARVQTQDTSILDQIARCFSSGPLKDRSMRLVGHADPRGETEYNFVLGHSRADAVGGFLRSKGVDKGKMDSSSRGELDATGADESGWSRDRRVDVMLAQ